MLNHLCCLQDPGQYMLFSLSCRVQQTLTEVDSDADITEHVSSVLKSNLMKPSQKHAAPNVLCGARILPTCDHSPCSTRKFPLNSTVKLGKVSQLNCLKRAKGSTTSIEIWNTMMTSPPTRLLL